jgi:hypothetical protein
LTPIFDVVFKGGRLSKKCFSRLLGRITGRQDSSPVGRKPARQEAIAFGEKRGVSWRKKT